jgi:hypothetical protein
VATETQYFYQSPEDAAAAFATLVQTFADCTQKASTSPDPGTVPLAGASGAVRHEVFRVMDGLSTGSWVHVVRFADGTVPKAGGDSYREFSDSHYAVALGTNVLDVLEMTGTSAIDAPVSDNSLVVTMFRNMDTYYQPPTLGSLPTSNATRMWQAWPPPQSLPAPAGTSWSGNVAGSTSVDPTTGGPVGNLACTQITAVTPKDPTLRLDDEVSYRAHDATPGGPRLTGNATILEFTDPAAATATYAHLVADMATCAARLRSYQTQAKQPADATVAPTYQGPTSSVWTVTATGYDPASTHILPANVTPDQETHHVMILTRGPFVEVIDLSGSGQLPYTLTTDLAVIAAAIGTLCNFKNVCS